MLSVGSQTDLHNHCVEHLKLMSRRVSAVLQRSREVFLEHLHVLTSAVGACSVRHCARNLAFCEAILEIPWEVVTSFPGAYRCWAW